jgi:hypothetical protein
MDPSKMTPEELEQFIHRELRALPPRKAPAGFEARLQAKLDAHQSQSALSPAQLEKLVHQELRALPLRRAPRTLESRVLAAIEEQAMIPWYHKSWSYWPAVIRATFLALATGVTGAVVIAFAVGFNDVEQSGIVAQAGERLNFLTGIYHVAAWMVDFGAQVIGGIPPLWLYGGAVLVALMYATFFGLGAFAYRTLYRNN